MVKESLENLNSKKLNIIAMIAAYNSDMYEYGKNVRCYGTSQELRIDQTHIIDHIGKNPDCNLKDIAEATDNSLSTVSLQITRLIRLGLVKKQRSKYNQREIVLSLTEDGQKVYEYHENIDKKWAERFLSRLEEFDDGEIAVIERFLDIIQDPNLNNI